MDNYVNGLPMRGPLIRSTITTATMAGLIVAVSPPASLWWTSGSDPPRWQLSSLANPGQALAAVEERWRADLAQRGSNIHPEGRCYFNADPDDGRIHRTHQLYCGPVAHWAGTVEPTATPSPTVWVDGIPLFGPDYTPITARAGRWDIYNFMDIERADNKLIAATPRGFFLGTSVSDTEIGGRLWRPDGLQPPEDLGAALTQPTPPPRAVIPPPAKIPVDIDHTYHPPPYLDDDLSVSYRLHIHSAEWTLHGALDGNRRLVLDIDITAETTPGYRVTGALRDIVTVTADDGTTANPTSGAMYRLDTNQTPRELAFTLPDDTVEIELTISPILRYGAQHTGLQPREGRIELPPDTITFEVAIDN